MLIRRVVPMLVRAQAGQAAAGLSWVIKGAGGRVIGQGRFMEIVLRPALESVGGSAAVIDDRRPFR